MIESNEAAEPRQASENGQRQWTRPVFGRLGGLSQVADGGGCGPNHLPGSPFCPPS
jgi:hypothetical protein